MSVVVVATFRVAGLTLHTRKLWLVGVATDRNACVTLACVSFHFSLLFFSGTKNLKNQNNQIFIMEISKNRKIKKSPTWTLKVALRPSGVFLVCLDVGIDHQWVVRCK